jgi:hypothetical protein
VDEPVGFGEPNGVDEPDVVRRHTGSLEQLVGLAHRVLRDA